MKQQLQGSALLILTAILWGCAFVAQRTASDDIDPYTFTAGRGILAFLFLLIICLFRSARGANKHRRLPSKSIASRPRTDLKTLIFGGLLCGLALLIGFETQQIAMITTSAGKAGFITALYIVEVPILSLVIGKRPRLLIWFCVIIALVALWLLTVKPGESLTLGHGDVMLIIGSVAFAIQILLVDHFVQKIDPILLATGQFFTLALGGFILMLLLGDPSWAAIKGSLVAIAYAGIISNGIGFTLQIIAQKHVNPTVASLLMSLEAVFAVLGGWILIHEQLSPRELMGCAIMFVAIVLSQLPARRR